MVAACFSFSGAWCLRSNKLSRLLSFFPPARSPEATMTPPKPRRRAYSPTAGGRQPQFVPSTGEKVGLDKLRLIAAATSIWDHDWQWFLDVPQDSAPLVRERRVSTPGVSLSRVWFAAPGSWAAPPGMKAGKRSSGLLAGRFQPYPRGPSVAVGRTRPNGRMARALLYALDTGREEE